MRDQHLSNLPVTRSDGVLLGILRREDAERAPRSEGNMSEHHRGTCIHAVIEFDLNGQKAHFDDRTVRRLCALARAGAGSSTKLNDLAVILDRALTSGHSVTLQRAETRAFETLLEQL